MTRNRQTHRRARQPEPAELAARFFRAIIRHRVAVVVAVVVATIAFATQLPKLTMDPDTESYVPKKHPIRQVWDEARERFGIGREILVAVEATGARGIFTPEILAGLAELTEGIKNLEAVVATDVRSLADAEAIVATEEGLDFHRFYDDDRLSPERAAAVREMVAANPVYHDRLVSRDGTIAAIVVRAHHQPGFTDPTEVYRQIAEFAADHPIPGARILIAGDPAVEYTFGRQMAADLTRLIPLSLFVVVAILYLCFPTIGARALVLRASGVAVVTLSWCWARGIPVPPLEVILASLATAMLTAPGVLLPFLVVVMSVVWTWGLQAAIGLPVYVAGTMVPPLLLAIGCADGLHIMERYFEKARERRCKADVVESTMIDMWRPVVLTSVTTAAGFGSLMVGRMTVYQVFGFTTAFGILAAMLMSLTFLPAMLAIIPLPAARARHAHGPLIPRVLSGLGVWTERHRWAVTVAGVIAVIVFTVGATRVAVDYSWVESLQEGSPVLVADRVLRARHGGTMPFNVVVRAKEKDGIKDPALLRGADAVLAGMAAKTYVGDTRSLAEYIKRMNQAMNEDRPEEFRVPDHRDLVAQYLLLYSISGDPTELDDMVDYDYQAANLAILLRSDRMQVLDDAVSSVEALLDQHVRPLGASATVTGSAMIEKTVLDIVLTSQILSLATAAVLVFLFLWLLFRSLLDALVCMLGPAFTAAANFGGMGLFGIPLGPDRAMVSAIALGIGIDYSIHLMSRFRDSHRSGRTIDEAIVEAMRTTGRAILFNGLVVVAGFTVIAFSPSPSNAVFGLMVATNMAVSCVAALVILPAALTILGHLDAARALAAHVGAHAHELAPRIAELLHLGGPGRRS